MLKSMTVWGLIIMALPLLSKGLALLGIPVSTAELEALASGLSVMADAVIQIVGFAVALKGRMRAKGPLKGLFVK